MSVPTEYRDLFATYTRSPAIVREAITGLDAAGIAARGGEEWSIRDILHHIADAEMVRGVRLRMAIADEEAPSFVSFDEPRWQRRLQYLWRSPEASLALYEQLCFGNAEILSHCERAAWERYGNHPTEGPLTVARLVNRGVEHAANHASQIAAIRARIAR